MSSNTHKLTDSLLCRHGLYRQILEHCNEGVNVVDTEGIILFTNSISADYAGATVDEMLGKSIFEFYPNAILSKVLITHEPVLDKKIHHVDNKSYMLSAYPLFIGPEFVGAYSIFKETKDIESLNNRVKALQIQLSIVSLESDILSIIGNESTLKPVLSAAKRTVASLGGPRHSIIIGESGTGKTMLARLIHKYAIDVGALSKHAPFVEINCAQYTNADIAAVDIFGSEEGAYTGSKHRKGLFEQSNGGILFLDEAHALENYQNMLLKAIESGMIRRIGGSKEISVNVIIIAASTRNLKKALLPELYQRLAQYELSLPSLADRSMDEKNALLDHFIHKYELAVNRYRDMTCHVTFTAQARATLLKAHYPRNIRQFRDVINLSIDSASPLIPHVKDQESIHITVALEHLPVLDFSDKHTITETERGSLPKGTTPPPLSDKAKIRILELKDQGYGPRRIAGILIAEGIQAAYYQVSYFLKNR